MRKSTILGAIMLAAVSLPLPAQWKITTAGVPRLKGGEANMAAPAPKRADGKPDLTGIWLADPPKLRDASKDLKPGELVMTPAAQKLFDIRKTGALSGQELDE